jgi:toxin ParE1/3/4
MIYTIEFTPRSEQDLVEACRYIARESPQNGASWLLAIESAIDSLEEFPARCPPALESATTGRDLRQLVESGYRIIFSIRGDTVVIQQVRHAARAPAHSDELEGMRTCYSDVARRTSISIPVGIASSLKSKSGWWRAAKRRAPGGFRPRKKKQAGMCWP